MREPEPRDFNRLLRPLNLDVVLDEQPPELLEGPELFDAAIGPCLHHHDLVADADDGEAFIEPLDGLD